MTPSESYYFDAVLEGMRYRVEMHVASKMRMDGIKVAVTIDKPRATLNFEAKFPYGQRQTVRARLDAAMNARDAEIAEWLAEMLVQRRRDEAENALYEAYRFVPPMHPGDIGYEVAP